VKRLGFDSLIVVTMDEFQPSNNADRILIADEFFDCMMEASFKFTSNLMLHQLFRIGFHENVLATTATYSDAFVKVLKKAYGHVGVISMIERGDEPANGGDQYKLHVVCDNDGEVLLRKVEEKILELSAYDPVIVFNYPVSRVDGLIKQIKGFASMPKTPEDLIEV
jgi:hypothetical protein